MDDDYMDQKERDAILGAKHRERRESNERLQCLRAKAMQAAEECQEIAYELRKAAGEDDPGERTPGLGFRARVFITPDQFGALMDALKAERKRLGDIEKWFDGYEGKFRL